MTAYLTDIDIQIALDECAGRVPVLAGCMDSSTQRVIENVQKALVSAGMKNTDLSGDPTAGTVEAKRFANATSESRGVGGAAERG